MTALDDEVDHPLTTKEGLARFVAETPDAPTMLSPAAFQQERTGGMIGGLSHLVREAALDAILNQTKKINRAGLDAIDLDQTAEHHRTQQRRRRTRGRTAAA